MGILDTFIQNVGGQEALSNALLGMGSNLLQASGPSTTPISTGQAIAMGIQGFQDSRQKFREEQQKKQLLDIQRGQLQAELQKRKAEAEKYQRELSDQETARMSLAQYADQIPDEKQRQAYLAALNGDPTGQSAVKMLQELGGIGATAGGNKFQFGAGAVLQNADGSLSFANPVFDPATGKVAVGTASLGNGVRLADRQFGQTAEQKMQTAIATEGGKQVSTDNNKRLGQQINEGIAAAEGTSQIRRALQLLDSPDIETSGLDAAALKAKRWFGVSGANAEELSSNLGTNVVSQLRQVFGPQFTENDRKAFEGYEAGFGKSIAGNKAILRQALKRAERIANRGADAAERLGQQDIVQQIEEALTYDMGSPDEAPAVTAPVASPTPKPASKLVFE